MQMTVNSPVRPCPSLVIWIGKLVVHLLEVILGCPRQLRDSMWVFQKIGGKVCRRQPVSVFRKVRLETFSWDWFIEDSLSNSFSDIGDRYWRQL